MTSSVSIHDRDTIEKHLKATCTRFAGMPPTAQFEYQRWATQLQNTIEASLKTSRRKYQDHCGNRSRYTPHIGVSECERRVIQRRARIGLPVYKVKDLP